MTLSLPSLEKLRADPTFLRRQLRSSIPSQVLENSPNLEAFLNAYFDYLWQEDNLAKKISDICEARDFDSTAFIATLKRDLAKEFPDTPHLDDRTLLRILYLFFLSKGSTESIEAYFRVILNASNVDIEYPKDNMLRCSDGEWSASLGNWTSNRGKLSETTMVLQDSDFYQIYSYLIRSDLEVSRWGAVYEKILHPSGWKYFAEVVLLGFAAFETEFGDSPTIQSGLLTPDQDVTIWLQGQFEAMTASSFVRIIMRSTGDLYDWSASDLEFNILNSSTITFADIASLTFEDFENDIATTIRPGAYITITP